ncbi:MAG TPA: TAXI family TRAP transporter solute-binding subunit [Usitatibacteraceae bacterium]|nr:TAXI family TRAP transporter solute-binding subunit [Usitatibacteraceae bacterium]
MRTKAIAALVAGATTAILALPVGAADNYVTVGTGGITGVYYPVGGAICRLVNQGRKDHGLRCTVESTGGSVFNINAIASGDLDVGVAQSDTQYYALQGKDKFDGKPVKELRALFALHAEPFTVVARKDANVKNWDDLKGKRVNIGDPGSGTRSVTEMVMKETGMTAASFKLATDLKPAEMAGALCDNKIDAFTYVVGHPNASIKEASTTCASNLVNVTGPGIDKLMKANTFYPAATIPGKMYTGSDADTKTFGPRATIVTSSKLSDKAAYAIVKAVFDNLNDFKKLHPALENLQPAEMLTGNTVPYHPGAVKYFKEKGLMK